RAVTTDQLTTVPPLPPQPDGSSRRFVRVTQHYSPPASESAIEAGSRPALPPSRRWRHGDRVFAGAMFGFALAVPVLAIIIATVLFRSSDPSRAAFGWSFLWTSTWDPVAEKFGALPFIYGTLMTSVIGLALAVPLGIGAAIFLAEF